MLKLSFHCQVLFLTFTESVLRYWVKFQDQRRRCIFDYYPKKSRNSLIHTKDLRYLIFKDWKGTALLNDLAKLKHNFLNRLASFFQSFTNFERATICNHIFWEIESLLNEATTYSRQLVLKQRIYMQVTFPVFYNRLHTKDNLFKVILFAFVYHRVLRACYLPQMMSINWL